VVISTSMMPRKAVDLRISRALVGSTFDEARLCVALVIIVGAGSRTWLIKARDRVLPPPEEVLDKNGATGWADVLDATRIMDDWRERVGAAYALLDAKLACGGSFSSRSLLGG